MRSNVVPRPCRMRVAKPRRGCQFPGGGRSQRGEYSQGCLRSKNSGSPTLSAFISSIWAFASGGGSLRSPSRAAERTSGLDSTYLARAYNGQELLIGTPPDDDGSGAAGAAGPWHHLRVPVVAADGRTVGTLDGVSRLQSEQEAKVLIMMNLLARTIADRLDPGASATPRRQAPQASSMPSRHGRTSA
jgi:hypothetical protein